MWREWSRQIEEKFEIVGVGFGFPFADSNDFISLNRC